MDATVGEVQKHLGTLPPAERAKIINMSLDATKDLVWVPNAGPQTEAYFSEADELLYGGEVGGGKSDLLLGLALTAHTRALVLRRFTDDARALAQRTTEILGHDKGLNRQLLEWKFPHDKLIEYGGCKDEGDKQRYKGRPHDVKLFDELADFTETQFDFICIWARTTTDGQRCRVVAASNPPTTAEGMWIVERWGPWLDKKHPNPAEDGELRWFVRAPGKKEIAVDGPGEYGPYMVKDEEKMIAARSRTFIRSRLEDNPDLMRDPSYGNLLDNLGPELRDAYREGNFEFGMRDTPHQLIPSAWIREAQERWGERPPKDVPMCTIACDPACGGDDDTTVAFRHDAWFGRIASKPGKQTPLGADVAALILGIRRDAAEVVIDMGGGYGNATAEHLKSNNVSTFSYNGAKKSRARTSDRTLAFANIRAQAHWEFREALDPSQPGGSAVALPPDRAMIAELTAPNFTITRQGILIEKKESVKDRLGRSPDRGDAIVMCWFRGPHAVGIAMQFEKGGDGEQGLVRRRPKVLLGRLARRKHRRNK